MGKNNGISIDQAISQINQYINDLIPKDKDLAGVLLSDYLEAKGHNDCCAMMRKRAKGE
jgi:hypothetical protein